MYEYELPEYNDFQKLYNNLMAEKIKTDNITTDSTKREDLITQMLMDNLGLELSKDTRFVKGRFIYYYDISYYEEGDEKKIINNAKILKTSKDQDFDFKVNGIIYKINLNYKNSQVYRNKLEKEKTKEEKTSDSKEETLSLHTMKTNKSDRYNDLQEDGKNTNFSTKRMKDTIDNKTYILKITHTNHEVDGYVIAKEDINIRDSLKQLLYYPIIEVESSETEVESLNNDEKSQKEEKETESNHENINSKVTEKKEPTKENYMPEKPTIKEKPENNDSHKVNIIKKNSKEEKLAKTVEDIEELTKIKKKSKILIEVKQNTSLVTLFKQIETAINDLKIILPDEQFYYFGFVNEVNAKSGLKERDFIENIKNFELQNPNYKIFLFIIKDNTFFDLPLDDKADYSTFYRNEIKKEIKEIKNQFTSEIKEMKTEIKGMKTEIQEIKNQFTSEIKEIKNNIQNLMDYFGIGKKVNKEKESNK